MMNPRFLHLVIFILFSVIPYAAFSDESNSAKPNSEMMNIVAEGRFPNYILSIGMKGGYLQPYNRVSDFLAGGFTGSLFFRINLDPYLGKAMSPIFGSGSKSFFQGFLMELEGGSSIQEIKARADSYNYMAFVLAGPRYCIPFFDFFSINLFANFGWMMNQIHSQVLQENLKHHGFLFKGGLEFEFLMAYHSDLSIGVSYQTPFNSAGNQGFGFYAGYSYRIGGQPRENQLKISNPSIAPIFPSLNKLYASKESLGNITIMNSGDEPIEDIQIGFYLEGYMNNPTLSKQNYELKPEERLIIPMYAVFNHTVMDVKTDQTISGEIIIRYEIDGTVYTKRETVSSTLYNKNALIWDPSDRICAFVSTDDPVIKQIRSALETEFEELEDFSYVNKNIRKAMKAFEALKSVGLKYLSDPNKPFAVSEESGLAKAIDTVQYPCEFLSANKKTGDCDDFSVLYASLLESVGVPTGFILTPRHIFTLFNTGVPEESLGMITEDKNKVVIYDGMIWIPVETTFLDKDKGHFIDAWEIALQEYKNNIKEIELIFIEESWKKYPPVSLTESGDFAFPDYVSANQEYNQAILAYRQQHRKSIDRALASNIHNLSSEEKRNTAIEFIKIHQPENAIRILESMMDDGDNDFEDTYYLAVAYMQTKDQMQNAIDCFMKAEKLVRDADATIKFVPRILLNIAQCYDKLGRITERLRYYDKAKQMNPVLAVRYDFLGESTQSQAVASDVTEEAVPLLLE